MHKIIQYYGLDNQGYTQASVDFLNLHLDKDNRIYLDYNRIITLNNPMGLSMKSSIDSFLGSLFSNIFSNNTTATDTLLRGLHECNSTKLGMSSKKPQGNSVGPILKDLIHENANYVVTALKTGQFSTDVLYFGIDQVGPDRTSDILVSIVKMHLIDFTQAQCIKHHISMTNTSVPKIFNGSNNKWETKKLDLPFYNGEPVIFVPKNIVSSGPSLNSTFGLFLRYGFNNFVKNNPQYAFLIDPNGKSNGVKKKDYKAYIKGNNIKIKDEVKKWIESDPLAIVNFQGVLSGRLTSLSDTDLDNIIG